MRSNGHTQALRALSGGMALGFTCVIALCTRGRESLLVDADNCFVCIGDIVNNLERNNRLIKWRCGDALAHDDR
jgi:hypothetical protein